MTDMTMRSLLDVHRTELNERDATIRNLESRLTTLGYEKGAAESKVKTLTDSGKRAHDQLRAKSVELDEKDARIAKLKEANASLNVLLTSERSAFSAYRDTHPTPATDGDSQ